MSLAVTDESGESSAISNSTIMSQVAEGLAEMYDALPVPLNFDLTVAEALYVQLYVDTDEKTGKQTSRKERDAKGYINSGLIYGEVEFGPFAEVLINLKRYGLLLGPKNENDLTPLPKFVDIGCGIGKAVFTAALVAEWRECVGIEILEGLYNVCEGIFEKWQKEIHDQLPEERQQTNVYFTRGDATALAWPDADVVFANSTCFSPELMNLLAAKASLLKDGAVFITTTKQLPSEKFVLLEERIIHQSFGQGTIYIHMKGESHSRKAIAKAMGSEVEEAEA